MGSGLADHEPAAVGTGGSESNRVSGAAVGTKGGIETKVAGFGDCYLYIIFRCAAPWDRGCTDSKRRRGAPGDSPRILLRAG